MRISLVEVDVALLEMATDCREAGTIRLSVPIRVKYPQGGEDQVPWGKFRGRRPSNLNRQNPESSQLLQSLQRMARGEHVALGECYDLMGSVVFSLAVRMLRDRSAAEDVTQDIFVQVWRQAANYDDGRGSPQAWVMMIARTRILDRLRSRNAGIVLKPVGDRLPDSPAAEDWPDDLAITQEDAVHGSAAIRSRRAPRAAGNDITGRCINGRVTREFRTDDGCGGV
jgi:DNA-directed RNA polymerase specialized sigma24 family protein